MITEVASTENNQSEESNGSLAQENNTQVAENNSPTQPDSEKENIQEVSGVTVESLSFHLEDGIAWPVHGEIILPFSIDHAVYHKTLTTATAITPVTNSPALALPLNISFQFLSFTLAPLPFCIISASIYPQIMIASYNSMLLK